MRFLSILARRQAFWQKPWSQHFAAQQLKNLTRRYATFSGRKLIAGSLAIVSLLTGNKDFEAQAQTPEFYRCYPKQDDVAFDIKNFKNVVRCPASLKKLGLSGSCIVDELAMSELSAVVFSFG